MHYFSAVATVRCKTSPRPRIATGQRHRGQTPASIPGKKRAARVAKPSTGAHQGGQHGQGPAGRDRKAAQAQPEGRRATARREGRRRPRGTKAAAQARQPRKPPARKVWPQNRAARGQAAAAGPTRRRHTAASARPARGQGPAEPPSAARRPSRRPSKRAPASRRKPSCGCAAVPSRRARLRSCDRSRQDDDSTWSPDPPSSLDVDHAPQRVREAEASDAIGHATPAPRCRTCAGDVDADCAGRLARRATKRRAATTRRPTRTSWTTSAIARRRVRRRRGAEGGRRRSSERDRHRWELDPASADDFKERLKDPVFGAKRGKG